MNVIVTAGGRFFQEDPLYNLAERGYKAMLDIGGKPMIQWVLEALEEAKAVEKIVVVGLPASIELYSKVPLLREEDQGDMLRNLRAGAAALLKADHEAELALIVSSDVPLLDGNMIDWLISEVEQTEDDFYYLVIKEEVMEKRFPSSRRTYLKLKDEVLCGGDVGAIRLSLASKKNPIWQKVFDARKNPIKQARLIGLDIMFMILLRLVKVPWLEKKLSKRLDLRARVIYSPYAEVGMDVDKKTQYEMLKAELENIQEERA